MAIEFLDKSSIFDENDKAFLCEMFARFDHLLPGFEYAHAVKERARQTNTADLGLVFIGIQLKSTLRRGWARAGIPEEHVQTVANHVGTMATLIMVHTPPHLNRQKCCEIALLHDQAESIIGDFTPHDDITHEEKRQLESLAIAFMYEGHPEAQKFIALWEEFESCETPEGLWVKDVDMLEMVMQAQVYGHDYPDLRPELQQFWDYTEQRLTTNEGRQIFQTLKAAPFTPCPLKVVCNRQRAPALKL